MKKYFFLLSGLIFLVSACGGHMAHPETSQKISQPIQYTQGKPKHHLWDYKIGQNNMFSEATDVQLGEEYMKMQIKELQKQKIGVDSPQHKALRERIVKIMNRLTAVSDKPNYPYEVHIFDMPDIVNAFCLPGGKMAVFTGLFDREKGLVDEKNDDQIAAVLGHEIAHATLRHVTRRVTSFQTIGLLGTVATVALGQGVGMSVARSFDNFFQLGVNLYFPSYTRGMEKEADQVGFFYMAKAGFNPQAAVDIWNQAAQKGGGNATKTSFLSTHPASGERAKALKEWLPEALVIQKEKIK